MKKLGLTMFFISTLVFGIQTNNNKAKSNLVSKTKTQIDTDIVAIENEIRNNNIKIVEDNIKKLFLEDKVEKPTEYDKKFVNLMVELTRDIRKNEKVSYFVEYISDNEAKVVYQTRIPDINIFSATFFDEIDKRMAKKGIDTTTSALKKMNEKEKYNMVVKQEPLAKEYLQELLNSNDLKYATEKYTVILKKQNEKWEIVEEY